MTMTEMTRRRLLVYGATLGTLLVSCSRRGGSTATPSSAATNQGPWTFEDDRGKTVELDTIPQRIVAQSTSAAVLWDMGIHPVGIFGPQRTKDGSPDPLVGDVDLDQVKSVGEVWGQLNLERLTALAPDVIVTTLWGGDLWYIPPEIEKKVRAIAPIVAIEQASVVLTEPLSRFEELGSSLGGDLESPEFVAGKDRFAAASESLKAALSEAPGLEVLFLAAYTDGLLVAQPRDWSDLEYFQSLGMSIVDPASQDAYWESLSWEQVDRYPADLILYDARSDTGQLSEAEMAKITTWSRLPAVKAGQLGPWYPETTLTYTRYSEIMEELATIVSSSSTSVA